LCLHNGSEAYLQRDIINSLMVYRACLDGSPRLPSQIIGLTNLLDIVWIEAHYLACPCKIQFSSTNLRPCAGQMWASRRCANFLARPPVGRANPRQKPNKLIQSLGAALIGSQFSLLLCQVLCQEIVLRTLWETMTRK
jgi:hypothetical protein